MLSWQEPKKHSNCKSLLGVTKATGWPHATLKDWKAHGLIKQTRSGNWSTRAIWKVYENKKRIQQEASKAKQVEASDKGSSNLEAKRFYDAVLRKIEVEEKLCNVVTTESVRVAFMAVSDIVRSNLQSASNRLSLKLAKKNQRQVQEILQAELVGIADKVQEQVDQLELESPSFDELGGDDD